MFISFFIGVCTFKPPEEVPETMSSDTATATVKDVPLELTETAESQQEATSAAAADQDNQDNQEIDIEETGESSGQVGDDVPMELTTPLSSGSELNLSFDSELVDEKDHQDKIAASTEVATIKKDDETMDVDVVGEGATTASTTPRTERVDSVQIDPSFKPESEELLYEGDVENDGEENKPAPSDSQPSATAAAGAATHEEGFVLAVDDTFADLNDVAPSAGEKSSSKKPESSSSKLKSEKSLSKSQSTSSNGQSGKAKTEVSSSSSSNSATTTTTTAAGSSKHTAKETGKSTSSDSTESATSRFVYCWTLHLLPSSRFKCHS